MKSLPVAESLVKRMRIINLVLKIGNTELYALFKNE
jgi:hypothetical protein